MAACSATDLGAVRSRKGGQIHFSLTFQTRKPPDQAEQSARLEQTAVRRPSLATSCCWQRPAWLRRQHQLERATQTSLTGPPLRLRTAPARPQTAGGTPRSRSSRSSPGIPRSPRPRPSRSPSRTPGSVTVAITSPFRPSCSRGIMPAPSSGTNRRRMGPVEHLADLVRGRSQARSRHAAELAGSAVPPSEEGRHPTAREVNG